jgi:hypothetical protein
MDIDKLWVVGAAAGGALVRALFQSKLTFRQAAIDTTISFVTTLYLAPAVITRLDLNVHEAAGATFVISLLSLAIIAWMLENAQTLLNLIKQKLGG